MLLWALVNILGGAVDQTANYAKMMMGKGTPVRNTIGSFGFGRNILGAGLGALGGGYAGHQAFNAMLDKQRAMVGGGVLGALGGNALANTGLARALMNPITSAYAKGRGATGVAEKAVNTFGSLLPIGGGLAGGYAGATMIPGNDSSSGKLLGAGTGALNWHRARHGRS